MKKRLSMLLAALLCAALMMTDVSLAEDDDYTTITVFCANSAAMPMTPELTAIQALGERTKTKFEFVVSPTTGTAEKFNLMMASGDIPDMVLYVQDPILKYTKAFEPLNDLIAEYCPNYERYLDEMPSVRKAITAVDGNIYTIQSISPLKFANAFIVRQDWLDKLGLDVPTTLDEYYEVLKAFKEQDPNGNGEADEIPLLSPSLRRADAESPGLSIFAASFGIDEDFYLSDDGNEILFGATDPRMKEVLTYLNKLYSEGLIDPEYLTRDWASVQGLQAEEKAGMWIDWGIGVDSTVIENPESNLQVILPPAGEDGVVRIYSQMPQVRTNAMAISKSSPHKEHIMSIFNYIFSDEGYMLMNYGVEGVTYTMEDGEPVYTAAILEDGTSPLAALRKHGINTWFPLYQAKGFEYASEKFIGAVESYEQHIIAPVPPLKFTDEERSTITSLYQGEIKTYLDESLDGFITGKVSLDTFDSFVETLNKMGLPDILQIYNDALTRYNAS